MSLGSWNVSPDEKDAVTLVSTLVRAIRKWGEDSDIRIQKRAIRAEDWLNRYNQKHPYRMLRDNAVLSNSEASPDE